METIRVQQFLTVARSGSIRAAAEMLNITPGGLSKSLSVFEDELSLGPLFKRHGRNILLTTAGRSLESRCEKFLREVDNFLSPPDRPRSELFTISTFEVFSTYFLSNFLQSHRSSFRIRCLERIPNEIELDVKSGKADIGITYEPIPMQGIDFLKVARIRMGVFGRSSVFKNTRFEDIPFAAPRLPIEFTPSGTKGLDGWPDDRSNRKIQFEVDMLETALGLARHGLAVVHLPVFVAKMHNEIAKSGMTLDELKSPISPIHRTVYLVLRQGEPESPTSKKLAMEIRALGKL